MFNNPDGNKKRITAIVLAVVLAVAAVAGIATAVRATTSSTVPVVPAADLNYGEYLDWQNSITGVITTDAEQNIYLSDTETVQEVLVTEGQSVHSGDVLLRYDISSTQMNLEKEKINREKIELAIEVSRENLKTLENTSPVSDGDDLGFFEDFMEEEAAEEEMKKATVYEKELKADAKPMNDDPEDETLGTEDFPYIFLCQGDSVVITREFIAKWQKVAKKNKMKQLYIELQKRDKALHLQKAWVTDIMLMDPKYDVEVDLTTGETSFAKMNDPAEMAKLLRKILKEVPEDERGAWLAAMMDKLLITSEKEDKKKDRGELLAAMLNELNAEDQEEFAEAAALLDAVALSSIFESLSENLGEEDIAEIDPDAVAGMLTLLLGNMTKEQISAIDKDVLSSFVSKLSAEQLSALEPEVLGEILINLSSEQFREVMNMLLEAREDELVEIVQEYVDEHSKEEDSGSGSSEDSGSGSSEDSGSGNSEDSGSGNSEDSGSGNSEDSGSGNSEDSGSGSSEDSGSGSSEDSGSGEDQGSGSGEDSGSGSGEEEDSGKTEDQSSESDSRETSQEQETEGNAGETTPSTSPSPSDDGGGDGGQLLSGDLAYTSDELAQAKREERDKLRDLELDLKESDIKIQKAQNALDKGVVTANMNGVIKTVGDPASPPTDGSAFLTVAGSEGLFVRSGVKESKLGTVKEGDTIMVTSWQTGGQYEAVIKNVSPYPDTTGMFDDSQSETYYPFTANILDKDAELTNGDWVEVSYTSGSTGDSSGAMTIMKAFVREEGNKKYVYVRDEDNRLKKQYIITGTLSDSGYEIIDGLSESDWVAFPYGKNVKEGAKTREGTLDELYN